MTQSMFAVFLLLSSATLGVASNANPVRKVVTMLQKMQVKVAEEGEKEEGLYKKFMCYCKNNVGELDGSLSAAKTKLDSLGTMSKELAAKKAQTEQDLKEHQRSRADAKEAMGEATALREKEAGAYAKVKDDSDANLAALTKAITALESGMAGSFLQTPLAKKLQNYAAEKADLPDERRQELLSFLSGSSSEGYVPQSGEITGILQEIKDEMEKDSTAATGEEKSAISSYGGLMAAKKKEVDTLTVRIEVEMTRIGDLGVQIATTSEDIDDTTASLSEDEKFLLELNKGCSTKTQEWEEVKKTRAEELVALADTIKVLNDDDALELFKKTLPSASASFMEIKVTKASVTQRALVALHGVKRDAAHAPQLDLIELALRGKQKGFDKVVAMIDAMIGNLKKEQVDDDSKKAYCEFVLDEQDDKKKVLEQSFSDSEVAIEELEGSIDQLKEEIAALEAGIKELDKAVVEATAQRKEENAEYKELTMDNNNAKEVLLWAKNRLNKFYNPKLYKPAPKRDLDEADQITVNFGGEVPTTAPGGIAGTGIGFVQISAHSQDSEKVAPPPPPETFGPYSKKTEESAGVLSMIGLLVADLDKETSAAGVEEKNSQEAYEKLMADAREKRAQDAKSLTGKSSAKAEEEESVAAEKDRKKSTAKQLMVTVKVISSIHQECDWLMKYFDVRKDARAGEVDSLAQAKAVLSGADYSLMQTARVHKFLQPQHHM